MRFQLFSFLSFCALLPSATAFGAIEISNWTINLGGVAGTNTSVFEGIDRLGFNQAINHVVVTDNDAPGSPGHGVPSPGDTGVVRGALVISGLFDEDGVFTGGAQQIFTPNLNAPSGFAGGWEITAGFEANVAFLGPVGPTINFVHTGGANTFLDLYIDELDDLVGVKANAATGDGYNDGTPVASFVDSVTGAVNPFSPSALDGSDDAIFDFVSGTGGILFSLDGANDGVASGTDLVTGTVPSLLQEISTDENFDRSGVPLAAWANGLNPDMWSALFPGAPLPSSNADQLNFFTLGDGSAVIAGVPEPASLLAWLGLSALGVFAGVRRRSRTTA